MTQQFDRSRAAHAVRELLLAYGLDPDTQQLAKTPGRVAESFAEFFNGLGEDPAQLLANPIAIDGATGELVVVRDIQYRSVCEHHLLPFQGTAHIAYLPAENVIGLSALPRLVQMFASRPQVQERLGEQVAETIEQELNPQGVLVVLEARHGCLTDRGVAQRDARVTTIASRGAFAEPVRRAEAISLMLHGGEPSGDIHSAGE
ncbi:MAG: GTP cyclohydrolase I FolE [Canibacter sp.]